MTNNEAIRRLVKLQKLMISAIEDDIIYVGFDEDDIEALETAVAALAGGPVMIELTEIHKFADPDDVAQIDFPGTSREDK